MFRLARKIPVRFHVDSDADKSLQPSAAGARAERQMWEEKHKCGDGGQPCAPGHQPAGHRFSEQKGSIKALRQ